MTDDEWFTDLVDRLVSECEDAVESAKRMSAESEDDGVIAEFADDIDGLQAIIDRCIASRD